ncbi:MAG TPA: alpha/beta hydrolase [Pseudolabrys sp.]|jgi:phospholipase/carboxylesterase
MTDFGFIHRFVPATKPALPPLLLLHGTGGDENDLLPLGQQLSPGAALLSPRGKVLENGMARFFRRLAEGVFDLADLKTRTVELADFITAARTAYGLELPVAVGFSNGANIAAALLLMRPGTLAGALLMRAMLPFEPQPLPDLASMPVLLLSGAADPMVPAASRDRLAAVLRDAGAAVSHEVVAAGHNLTQSDLALAAPWLEHLQ